MLTGVEHGDGSSTPVFRVLGSIELLARDGTPVELSGDRQRALLAALVANSGRVVSVDTLTDLLWPIDGPENPPAALRNQVSRLRRALARATPGGERLLITAPPGYRLAVSADDIDAGRFISLVRQATEEPAAQAIESLQSALALWRGPAYAEFADTDIAQIEAIRLEGARTTALDQIGALLVEVGRASEALPLLESFVVQHPLHEGGWRSLVRALHTTGRQGDALSAYQSYRSRLAEELGLKPSAAMRALETQVLRDELPAPVAVPRLVADSSAARVSRAAIPRPRPGQQDPPSLESMRIRYVGTGRGPVAMGTVGNGPSMIALPGWVSSLEILSSGRDPRSALLQRLTRHFAVTMYDRAGTGLSREAGVDASLASAVDELRAVILAVEPPVLLLAMSQAGPVAVALAASSPDLVSRLVFFGTYASGEQTFTNPPLRQSLLGLFRSHYALATRLMAELYRPDASPEAAQHLAKVIRDSADQDVAATYLEAVYTADVRELLPSIKTPALVLHYRDDRVIPIRGGQQLAAGLPDVHFLAVDGGFHLPDLRDLDLFVDVVTDFCDLTSGRSDS